MSAKAFEGLDLTHVSLQDIKTSIPIVIELWITMLPTISIFTI